MTDSHPLVFYDISSPLQPRTYAPNPSKARLALNFKNIPFTTSWVDILDIPTVRNGLHCPATRKLDDGSDFHTLPIVQDPASNKVLGDSFDIATYLDDTYPDKGGHLFPADATHHGLDYESPHKDTPFYAPITTNAGAKHGDYARFNLHVDATFSSGMVGYGQFLPFNSDTAERVQALMAKRAHLKSWDDVQAGREQRLLLLGMLKGATESLGKLFEVNQGGPYLNGERATYADLIVGGWLNLYSVIMPEEEWKEFRTWHGGVFARLHDALQEKYFVCK